MQFHWEGRAAFFSLAPFIRNLVTFMAWWFCLCKELRIPLFPVNDSRRVTKYAPSRAGLQQQYCPEPLSAAAEQCPGNTTHVCPGWGVMHPASPWNFYSSLFQSPWQALKASHSHRWSSRCWQTPVWSFRQSTTFPSLSIRKVRPLCFAFTWCSCSETLPLPDVVLSPRTALTVPFGYRWQSSSSIHWSTIK